MTRARWMIAGSWLLLLWLLAGVVWLPALERLLTEEAARVLRSVPGSLSQVSVVFDGQTAVLTGSVRRQADRQEAVNLMSSRVRASLPLLGVVGLKLNPVVAIRDQIEVRPYPPGWIMLAANGPRATLLGAAADVYEARDVTERIRDRWLSLGGGIDGEVQPHEDVFDEAPDPEKTLRYIPPPRKSGLDTAQVSIARLGGAWQELNIDQPLAALKQDAARHGVSDVDWNTRVWPAIEAVRRNRNAERAGQLERERLARLPPPHLFFAARDQRVLLRGEVGSGTIKRDLMAAIVETFPECRVLDDVRVNLARRPVADFGPITRALLPGSGPGDDKVLALGLSGKAWQPLDWKVGREARPWAESLPADLPPDFLKDDSTVVIEWLQGGHQGIPQLPARLQPSFITLTLLPDRVFLAGQIAEEALRAQICAAVRQAYGARAQIMDEEFLARGSCEPSTDVQHTCRSLPPLPPRGSAGVLAFVRPGQVWRTVPATTRWLMPGELARSGLWPESFPAGMAEDNFAEGLEHLRHHLEAIKITR